MKIAVVQGAFLPVPPLRGGAIEKAWFGLGREFARRGHEVTHYSRRCDGLAAAETIAGVRHRRVAGFEYPKSALLLKWRDLVYARRVLRELDPADILVTHTFWLPILARRADRGLVYVHVARFPKGQMRLYSGAARLQAVSRSVARAIQNEAPRAADKIRTLPLPLPEDALERPDVPRLPKLLLYAGRIHPEKGLDLLLRAFAESGLDRQGWRLRLVGPHQVGQGGAGEEYLRRLKAASGTAVDFREPVFDPAALRREYTSAALFVYPSLAEKGESFGLAPLEAMACGCPALVSGLECFQEFLEDGQNGWTFNHRAHDPAKALAEKLRALADAPAQLEAFGQRARDSALRFSLPEVALGYLRDFAELLEARGKPI